MNLRRAIVIAVCLLPVAAGPAVAQSAWPAPQQQAPAPWPGQQQQQQQQPQEPATAAWPQPAQQPSQAAPAPWPTPQQQQQSRPSPWQQPPQQQQQQPDPACFKEFVKLRDAAQKRANAIQAAGKGKTKPSAKKVCGLFSAFSTAEAKMIKFVIANRTACSVPPQVIDGMKKQHAQTNKIRGNVCRVAEAPRGPAPPSLSDALSAPIADPDNIRSGGGTFDTLGGNPLGK